MTAQRSGSRLRDGSDEPRLAALGTLAAGMSHDVLNPVNTVSLACQYLEALLLKRERPSEEVIREHFRLIHVELGRIRKILDDWTKFRRIPVHRPEPTDLGKFLRDAVEGFSWPRDGPEIRRELAGLAPAEALTVPLDPGTFRYAFDHLLRNAVKAMPEGGVVRVAADRRGHRVLIELSDTGVGIPADQLSKVFEPYFTTRPDALGIGLTLVRTIVRAHRGSVSLRSRPGKGTKVSIRLPLSGGSPR